jgi:hypothetical protein
MVHPELTREAFAYPCAWVVGTAVIGIALLHPSWHHQLCATSAIGLGGVAPLNDASVNSYGRRSRAT